MVDFETARLPADPVAVAPDGTDVRTLLSLQGGSFAHFTLSPGQTSLAVAHRSVDEIWYVVAGRGEMWRRQGDRDEIVSLEPGACVTIPLGTQFQFRGLGADPLVFVAVTMPPWPGQEEAYRVSGKWAV